MDFMDYNYLETGKAVFEPALEKTKLLRCQHKYFRPAPKDINIEETLRSEGHQEIHRLKFFQLGKEPCMRPGVWNSIGILLTAVVALAILPGAATGFTESWKWIPFDHSGIRESEFRIIESGKDRIIAEAIFHGMQVDRVTVAGMNFFRVNIPGCGSTVKTGYPELPVLRKLLSDTGGDIVHGQRNQSRCRSN